LKIEGFGYEFNSLTEEPGKSNELHEAFKILVQDGSSASLIQNIRGLIPALRLLVGLSSFSSTSLKLMLQSLLRAIKI
jgi:hypothetical protein